MTLAVGVDLSGPSNLEDTALAFGARGDDGWRVVDWQVGVSDLELATSLGENLEELGAGDPVVALDAPLSYAQGGGLRPSDVALREELEGRGLPVHSVMAPTMTRMAYLSLRGIAVARLLEREFRADILEVHPTSVLYFRTDAPDLVSAMKDDPQVRRQLIDRLDLRETPNEAAAESDHLTAAIAALRAAADRVDGDEAWSFGAAPPAHPYPLVC